MNETTIDSLWAHFIEVYSPLLFDMHLMLAMFVAWGATHFFKLSPFVQACKRKPIRDWYIRAAAIVFGFISVMYFKRGEVNQEVVTNLAIFIAFANTALYKLFTAILWRTSPQAAVALSSNSRKKP